MDSDCPQLDVIRRLMDRIYSSKVLKPSNYIQHVRPNVIVLNTALTEMGYANTEERREIRLYILEAISRRPVTTTYDLPAYALTTITGYLESDGAEGLSEDGAILLEFLAREFEAGTPSYPNRNPYRYPESEPEMPDLPF
jgi:hypothetical protein